MCEKCKHEIPLRKTIAIFNKNITKYDWSYATVLYLPWLLKYVLHRIESTYFIISFMWFYLPQRRYFWKEKSALLVNTFSMKHLFSSYYVPIRRSDCMTKKNLRINKNYKSRFKIPSQISMDISDRGLRGVNIIRFINGYRDSIGN